MISYKKLTGPEITRAPARGRETSGPGLGGLAGWAMGGMAKGSGDSSQAHQGAGEWSGLQWRASFLPCSIRRRASARFEFVPGLDICVLGVCHGFTPVALLTAARARARMGKLASR